MEVEEVVLCMEKLIHLIMEVVNVKYWKALCMENKFLKISSFCEMQDMGKYIGVPLSGKRLRRSDYQYLLEQLSLKLSNLKTNHISLAGRISMTNRMMQAVLIYTYIL